MYDAPSQNPISIAMGESAKCNDTLGFEAAENADTTQKVIIGDAIGSGNGLELSQAVPHLLRVEEDDVH